MVPWPCTRALSIRFSSTCSMSMASMGSSSVSSGTETETVTPSWRLRKFSTASLSTSSRISPSFWICPISPPLMRVMESRFSTIRQSHSASCLASSSSSFFCSRLRAPLSSSTVAMEPLIAVRGVRRSWEMARSRLARIFSRSDSARSFSWAWTRVVRVLTAKPTASMVIKVRG